MQTFTLSPKSENVKTGPIPVSMSNSSTCPSACPFKANGCYAAQGPLNFIWKALDRGYLKRGTARYTFGGSWKAFIDKVKQLPSETFWRFAQAGDLPGKDNYINPRMLKQLVSANKGKRAYGYTHKPVLEEQSEFALKNREAIKHANDNGFTINLSGNNVAHADKLKALNIAPVVVVLPSDFKQDKGVTPNGNRFIVCPAQTKSNVTCAKCQLCQKQRSILIGFKSHGMSYKKMDVIANQI